MNSKTWNAFISSIVSTGDMASLATIVGIKPIMKIIMMIIMKIRAAHAALFCDLLTHSMTHFMTRSVTSAEFEASGCDVHRKAFR